MQWFSNQEYFCLPMDTWQPGDLFFIAAKKDAVAFLGSQVLPNPTREYCVHPLPDKGNN